MPSEPVRQPAEPAHKAAEPVIVQEAAPKEPTKAEEPPKAEPRPQMKAKTLDPNVKLDPFGGARPKVEAPIQPQALAASKRSEGGYVPPARRAEAAAAAAKSSPAISSFDPPLPSRAPAVVQPLLKPGQRSMASVLAGKPKEEAPAPVVPDGAELVVGAKKRDDEDPLVKALREKMSVLPEQLRKGLDVIELKSEDQQTRLGAVVALTLLDAAEGKAQFSLADAVETVQGNSKTSSSVSAIITHTLEQLKAKKGQEFLAKYVAESKVDISAVIGTFTSELVFLKSNAPDVGAIVSEALKSGRSHAEVMELVKKNSDASIDPTFMVATVSEGVFNQVFESKVKGDLDKLGSFQELLKHVTRSSAAQVLCLLEAHKSWAGVGSPKTQIKLVFEKLQAMGVISAQAFMSWKNDVSTKKVAGKGPALIQCLTFLNNVEASMKTAQPEDEEEDEEDEN